MLREVKVGLLLLASLAVLAVGIFLVGERSNLFARENSYTIRFETVAGLAAGNPVQLNGVRVGQVDGVVLPEDVSEAMLEVEISIDRRYAARVRADSVARIKTLGLLGDKYIEISSGSQAAPVIPAGGEIPAAPATDVDKLIASGEDLVDNVMAISVSLRNILAGIEAGKGILGELTTDSEAGRRAKEAMLATMESLQGVARKIETGEGLLATMINDPSMTERLNDSLDRLEAVLGRMQEGDGAIPLLLNDEATKDRIAKAIDDLGKATADFAQMTAEMQESDGLLKKLLADDEYGRQVSGDLQELISNLNRLSEKLERGDGTLGQLISDPGVYEAVNDILVGINESKLLRWLIRNRQKKGIEKRYDEESTALEATPDAAGPVSD